MKSGSLYKKARNHLNEEQPFVLYRAPNSQVLLSYFQNDNSLNRTTDYTHSGFVMAPFDTTEDAIIFPLSKSCKQQEQLTIDEDISPKVISDPRSILGLAYDSHIALIKAGIDTIKQGVLDKVVLSREEEIPTNNQDWINVFENLLASYPTAFVYIWYHPQVGLWLGATPETLLSIKKDKLYTMALAATQANIGATNVAWSIKEQDEQQIVTDYIKDTLQPWASALEISQPYTHRAGTLLHLRSDIIATIDFSAVSLQEIVQKLHPTPAVCGLPKQSALKFIKKNEPYDRKFYTGFLGEHIITTPTTLHTNFYVNLRCMQVQHKQVKIYVGGGITKDSNPKKEWEETVKKSQTIKKVLK
ncbi:chorismate-binding protein [Aquimarina sp. W85]|uniref:chorismate-binding protein n=1 Tax=Aquimarina rhodophyticola TaxID=3342246 RepID=UPI0036700C8E